MHEEALLDDRLPLKVQSKQYKNRMMVTHKGRNGLLLEQGSGTGLLGWITKFYYMIW